MAGQVWWACISRGYGSWASTFLPDARPCLLHMMTSQVRPGEGCLGCRQSPRLPPLSACKWRQPNGPSIVASCVQSSLPGIYTCIGKAHLARPTETYNLAELTRQSRHDVQCQCLLSSRLRPSCCTSVDYCSVFRPSCAAIAVIAPGGSKRSEIALK